MVSRWGYFDGFGVGFVIRLTDAAITPRASAREIAVPSFDDVA